MAVIVREKVKGSGEWWVFINHKGKRRSKKVGDKRAANAVKREVEGGIYILFDGGANGKGR